MSVAEHEIDLDLERAVLGQILTFDVYQSFVAAGLSDEDFHHLQHRHVWTAARQVRADGGEPDVITVGGKLRALGQLDEIGVSYFSALMDGCPKPSEVNIAYEVGRLQKLTTARQARYASIALGEALDNPNISPEAAVARHAAILQRLTERAEPDGPKWLDVAGQLSAHHDDVSHSTDARAYFGLPALDASVEGIRLGEVCGLMGRPGIGKTVFLSHIARAVTESSGHVFFSLEMPASQIVGRLKQMLYGLSRWELEKDARQGTLDDEAYLAAFRNLVIVDTPSLSVRDMTERLKQIQDGPLRDIPIRLVTIDHLGLIGGDRNLTTYDRVSTQAREIKELAKKNSCGVLVAIQVNRDAGGDGSKELGLGSARDSGVVEEAMDYLIGIRRLDRSLTLSPYEREKYADVIFAKVIKNRHNSPDQRETAYRFLPRGLELREDVGLQPEENDLARMAAPRNGRR